MKYPKKKTSLVTTLFIMIKLSNLMIAPNIVMKQMKRKQKTSPSPPRLLLYNFSSNNDDSKPSAVHNNT